MQDQPTAPELLLAVREFLETEIVSNLNDPRLKFRSLVAMNALGIVAREIELAEPALRQEYSGLLAILGFEPQHAKSISDLKTLVLEANTELSKRIRGGHIPSGMFTHLEQTIRAKLEVASPAYLKRYD